MKGKKVNKMKGPRIKAIGTSLLAGLLVWALWELTPVGPTSQAYAVNRVAAIRAASVPADAKVSMTAHVGDVGRTAGSMRGEYTHLGKFTASGLGSYDSSSEPVFDASGKVIGKKIIATITYKGTFTSTDGTESAALSEVVIEDTVIPSTKAGPGNRTKSISMTIKILDPFGGEPTVIYDDGWSEADPDSTVDGFLSDPS